MVIFKKEGKKEVKGKITIIRNKWRVEYLLVIVRDICFCLKF